MNHASASRTPSYSGIPVEMRAPLRLSCVASFASWNAARLSSGDDRFYQVTVTAIEWRADCLFVSGTAVRNFDYSVPQ